METFDFDKISQQVEDVIRYSQGFDDRPMNIKPLMDKWLKNKKAFIDAMDGKLIWEYPEAVSFHLSPEARADKLRSLVYDVQVRYNNSFLGEFLNTISDEEFFENKTNKAYTINGIIVPAGMKVIKAFKLFETNEKLLEDLQNAASRVIQEDIIFGRLCVSVHPLDYLSISENIHNWRSCHALDGDYRSGNLNYMVDNCTAICYLRNDVDVVLPHFPYTIPWNSKKWRVLLYFAQDYNMVFLSRQYPFSSDVGVKCIQKMLLPRLTGSHYWTDFQPNLAEDTIIAARPYDFIVRNGIRIGNSFVARREWVQDKENTHHFNDVTNSSFYTEPLYSYSYGVNNTSVATTTFLIGDSAPCPMCGSSHVQYDEVMLCDACWSTMPAEDEEDDEYYECSNCGDSYQIHEMIWLPLSGSYVCPYCFEDERSIVRCENCGVRDYSEYIQFNREKNAYLCRHCAFDEQRPTIESLMFNV